MELHITKQECGYLIDAVLTQLDQLSHYGNVIINDDTGADPNIHIDAYNILLEKLESLAMMG